MELLSAAADIALGAALASLATSVWLKNKSTNGMAELREPSKRLLIIGLVLLAIYLLGSKDGWIRGFQAGYKIFSN
jgi:hypothetical protein